MDTKIYTLSDCCRFHLGDVPDAWQAWYDDSEWEEVSLPHDWSVSLPFSREYSSGTGYLAGGIGWYRICITPREEWRGKQISIAFDGVYKNSRVWCNSYYLGERPNGYISFSYDITEQFSFDRDTVISVYVDRREISDSRWFTGSGITRKVSLVVEEAVHPVYNGIFFTTPNVTKEAAEYAVTNEITNTCDEAVLATVTNTLIKADGSVAAKASASKEIAAGSVESIQTGAAVAAPSLWSPETPCLYTLQTAVSYKRSDGTTVDSVADTKAVGIRSFVFDPDKGFFLNGKSTLFKGVCLHHDAGCLGAAVTKTVWRRRLQKLKAMGCNAIRMSHNPHMPELYELCDEMGFLVMDEAFDEWEGPKNKWWQGHNVYPPKNQGYYADFPQWHEKDLGDLIRRDYCHPSIVMWSIGNEIDYPNDPYCHPSAATMTGNNDANKPIQERMYNPQRPNGERLAVLAKHLTEVVKKHDTTRPVTLAAAFPELSGRIGFLDSLDVAGYNYKEHLYEESHRAFPNKPFLGSENGHSLSAWKAVTDKEYISGQFLWTGIDYLGEAHGWPIHGSSAGIMTLAGFEKTGYYRRQSFWAEKPVLHLAACLTSKLSEKSPEFLPVCESWNYPDGEEVLVKCYTNQPAAEFFLNGESLGIYSKDAESDCICLTVPFQAGVLSAIALDCDKNPVLADGKEVSHCLVTTGAACQIGLACWKDPVETSVKGKLYQVEATMLDRAGNRVYTDSTCLHVTVQNGRLLGIENGDLADVTDYSANYRRAFHGQLLCYVQATDDKEAPVLTVSGDSVKTASITL